MPPLCFPIVVSIHQAQHASHAHLHLHASTSELAMLSFASLLPKSILIGSLAILKTWIELVHSAREAGLSVRTKAIQLWQVG